MATTSTQWPTPSFPTPVKDLISLFYALIESHSDDVGLRLPMKCSPQTGSCKPEHRDSLAEKIIASRTSAWTHIASRKHVILKVYTGSVEEVGGDVVMVGNLHLVLKSGTVLEMEFVGRLVVVDALTTEPKIALCQAWADSAPLMKALSGSKNGSE